MSRPRLARSVPVGEAWLAGVFIFSAVIFGAESLPEPWAMAVGGMLAKLFCFRHLASLLVPGPEGSAHGTRPRGLDPLMASLAKHPWDAAEPQPDPTPPGAHGRVLLGCREGVGGSSHLSCCQAVAPRTASKAAVAMTPPNVCCTLNTPSQARPSHERPSPGCGQVLPGQGNWLEEQSRPRNCPAMGTSLAHGPSARQVRGRPRSCELYLCILGKGGWSVRVAAGWSV